MEMTNDGGANESVQVIDADVCVRGDLEGKGRLLIYGRVEGTVRAGQELLVGNSAHVRGSFLSRVVEIEGIVEGEVEASEKICLQSGSKVVGNLKAPLVVIDRGARYRGRIDMGMSLPSLQEIPKVASDPTSLFSRSSGIGGEDVEVVVERKEKSVGTGFKP